jgi:hypothetical protein
MKHSYREILLEILQIAHYQNKEKFIVEFEELNHLDAMANILPVLSHDVREYIKLNNADPEKIKKYIPQDLYLQELTKVSADALLQLTKDVMPTLNAQQKEAIAKLFSSY